MAVAHAQPKRFVLAWTHSVIEPLFALYLGGLIRDKGHRWTGVPIRKQDFAPLFQRVREFEATDVGFNVYSGSHRGFFRAADRLREQGIRVHIGGPHATYFAHACAQHADWVYKGQSFDSFGAMLDDDVEAFVVESLFGRDRAQLIHASENRERAHAPPSPEQLAHRESVATARIETRASSAEGRARVEATLRSRVLFRDWLSDTFPFPDRATLYADNPEFACNPIKNTICGEGCPFACTYCYNVAWNSEQMYGKFRRRVLRDIDDVLAELRELRRWNTQLVYVQDDVFGFELSWLREFMPRYRREVGIPMHAQLRLELARGRSGQERLALMKEGGCTGVTVAIESGSYDIRKTVLDRPMTDAHVFEGCRNIREAGLTLRTEQILGVPARSTRPGGSALDTDLLTLEVNTLVRPEIAWSAILAPYGGTELGKLCAELGLYPAERLETNDDLQGSFFDASALEYSALYKDQVRVLQRLFSSLSHHAHGAAIARRFIRDALPSHTHETIELFLVPLEDIAKVTKVTLYDRTLYNTVDDAGPGTQQKSGAELFLATQPASGVSLDSLSREAWSDGARRVLGALGSLWRLVPHGASIARSFLERWDAYATAEKEAFVALAEALGEIVREFDGASAVDRVARIEAWIAREARDRGGDG